MVRRTSLIVSEVLAGLLAGLVALGGLTAWRLHSGPLELEFLTPHLEEALSDPDSGFVVDIDQTVLVWAGWRQAIDILATDVRVTGVEGEALARVPELSFGLSLRALVRGNLAPTSLDAASPVIRIIRRETGEIALGFTELGGETSGAKNESGGERGQSEGTLVLRFLVNELLADPEPSRSLGYLRRISVSNAQFTFDDRLAGAYYRSSNAEIVAIKRADGIFAEAGMTLDYGGRSADFSANVYLARTDRRVRAELFFRGVEPAGFAASIPQLAPLTTLKMPLTGDVAIQGRLGGEIESVTFDLVGGAGELVLTDFFREPLNVGGLRLRGEATGDLRQISVKQAIIDLNGPTIYATAEVNPVGQDTTLAVAARVENVVMAKLGRYWPVSLAPTQRRWVTRHMTEGVTTTATIDVTARMRGGDPNAIALESLGGTLDYTDLSVDYYAGLPHFRGISGHGTYDRNGLYLTANGARVFEVISVDNGTVDITGISGTKEGEEARIDINVDVQGPIRATLELLDHKPLSLAGNIGIKPAALGGELAGRVRFEFPLFAGLTTAMLNITVKADLEAASAADGPFGLDTTDGKLALALTAGEMDIKGDARLNGVPVKLDWHQNFRDKSKFSRRFVVTARVNDEQRLALGLPDLSYWLKGTGDVRLVYTTIDDKPDLLSVRANLTDAALEVPEVGWRKAPGLSGELKIDGTVSEKGELVFQSLRLKTVDMDSDLRMVFLPDLSDIRRIDIKKARFSGSNITGTVTRMKNGGYDIDTKGKRIDVQHWLSIGAREEAGGQSSDQRPYKIRARFDEAYTGGDRRMYNALFTGEFDGKFWEKVWLQSTLGEGGTLSLSYAKMANGKGYELLVKSDDAGQAMRSLDWWSEIQGGSLVIKGHSKSVDEPIRGRFWVTDFQMAEAPAGLKLMQLLTIVGMPAAMAQKGVSFAGMEGGFTFHDGVLTLGEVEAWGPIGVHVDEGGWLDFNQRKINLTGVVVPVNALQGVLGKLPFIGLIFGEGLIATSFDVSGPLDKPDINPHPASTLNLGFLRKLFRTPAADGEKAPSDEPGGQNPRD